MMDVIDGHFVEDGDGVFIGGIFGWFENDLEPCGIGAPFFIEDNVADVFEIRDFHLLWVISFIVIDLVVFSEQKSNHGRYWGRGLAARRYIFRQDQRHDSRAAHRRGEDKECDQQETEIYHRGKVDACGEFFAFFHARAFFVGGAGGGVYFCHGIVFMSIRCRGGGIP